MLRLSGQPPSAFSVASSIAISTIFFAAGRCSNGATASKNNRSARRKTLQWLSARDNTTRKPLRISHSRTVPGRSSETMRDISSCGTKFGFQRPRDQSAQTFRFDDEQWKSQMRQSDAVVVPVPFLFAHKQRGCRLTGVYNPDEFRCSGWQEEAGKSRDGLFICTSCTTSSSRYPCV